MCPTMAPMRATLKQSGKELGSHNGGGGGDRFARAAERKVKATRNVKRKKEENVHLRRIRL